MKIHIRDETAPRGRRTKDIDVTVRSEDTVRRIKELIEQKTGKLVSDQRLRIKAHYLENKMTVKDMGFSGGETMFLRMW